MKKVTYVGLDVHKDTIAVAVAEDGRGGEIRFFGTIAYTADSVLRLTKQLAAAGNTPSFWVVSQFELSFLRYGPRFFGAGARASISPTIHSISCSVSDTPAAIAGVMRSDL